MPKLSDPDTWLTQYGDALYRHAFARLHDPMAAEEMVQETLLGALKARDRYAGEASEKTWLFGILKHKIIDYLRKAVREQPHNDETVSFDALLENSFDERGHWKSGVSSWREPDKALEQTHFWNVLEDCVSRLPQRLSSLFALRELDGLDSHEICNILDISSTNNLWVMLSRMRLRLRQCLDVNWFGHEERI